MTELDWITCPDPTKLINDWPMSHASSRKMRLFCVAVARSIRSLSTANCQEDQAVIDSAIALAELSADSEVDKGIWTAAQNALDKLVGFDEHLVLVYNMWNAPLRLSSDHYYHFIVRHCLMGAHQGARHTASLKHPTPGRICNIIHDLFGNPWQPLEVWRSVSDHRGIYTLSSGLGPSSDWQTNWITPQILEIANAAYASTQEDGAIDASHLAVLSDALEDRGCTEASLLDHLRSLPTRVFTCKGQGKHSHEGSEGGIYHGDYHDCDPRKPHHHHDARCSVEMMPATAHYRGCWALDLVLGRE